MKALSKPTKLFVWDLHGTLEQGNEDAVIELSNMALAELGYKERFLPQDSRNLYGLKWFEYFEHLLPNEPPSQHLELQATSFALSDANPQLIARYMRPAAHAHTVLQDLANSPHQQILISNTIHTAVPLFLKALAMEQFFGSGHAFSVNAHAREALRTKEDALTEFLNGKTFDQLVVIGDSATDLRLATARGATAYLYAHPGYEFRADGGDHRIHDLRRVLQEV
ncbi:MAG TPA: HAD hydrolase-like protein [Candidatus Saccharimonadales bacterium]|nr:HAD hydrolase-like protein [Candidatus Saccharimonadales bacterium]